MDIAVFEDELTRNFSPLTLTKPAFELNLGAKTLMENLIEALKPDHYSLHVREYLAPTVKGRHGVPVNEAEFEGELLLVNGMVRLSGEVMDLVKRGGRFVTSSGGNVALARVRGRLAEAALSHSFPSLEGLKGHADELELPPSSLIRYPWELIERGPKEIERQIVGLKMRGGAEALDGCQIIGPRSKLMIEEGAEVEGFVTFDTRRGPILLGRGSRIESFSRISGPAYIGEGSLVSSALIRGGTAIGPVVRVGGGAEVEQTIIEGYSNMAHHGYLGHSYVGEWANVGAATVASNLKNTYGSVKVSVRGEGLDSGQPKLGCFIADHVKTSIGTYIYSGKKIGVASQLHGYVSEDVPSFTIYAKRLGARLTEVQVESVIETQRRMMGRRGMRLSREQIELIRRLFSMTKEERCRAGALKATFSF